MTSFIRWSVGLLVFAVGCTSQDVFSEELLTGWLTPHHLLVHLRFDQGTTASRHHTSFPHAIQHLAATLPLHDVELSLTSGRWRYTEWGWPLVPAKPVGAVLDASFHWGLAAAALTAHWAALVNALSGLSCASLGQLHDPGAVSGGSIRMRDLVSGPAANSSAPGAAGDAAGPQRLHALLPHEPLCTENLTPWLRLLPCRDQAGLASLLRHRPTIFGAEYVSLGLLLERRTTARGRGGVRLVQTVTLVLRTAETPDADLRPDLEHILGARVEHICPAATRSELLVAQGSARAVGTEARGGACSPSDDAGPGGGSCQAAGDDVSDGAAAAAQDGALLLLPVTMPRSEGGPLPGVAAAAAAAAAGLSRALPPLRRYDTLDLLEVSGGGLSLPLPLPLSLPVGRSPGSGDGRRRDWRASSSPGFEGVEGGAEVLVDRYVTGAGLLRGGMVLRIQRSAQLRTRLATSLAAGCGGSGGGGDDDGSGSGGGSGGGGGAVCALSVLCVHQQFPWYVRPWLHTLVVLYDGQEVPLRPHVVAQQVRPALARASPGVLDLCLAVPPAVAEVQLRLDFSKAFLTVYEYPPDAHRGFDVPAALVSYLDPLYGPAVQWRAAVAGAGATGGGSEDGGGGGEVLSSPLLAALARGPVQQVYTPGLLVPLAAPDFSMPYNVICLSSTVLAIYFGSLISLLARRGGAEAAAAATGRGRASVAARAAPAVLMLGLFGALTLYLDPDARAQTKALLAWLGFPVGAKPPSCGAQRC